MKLKELRLSKGYTQVDVANALGIKQHSYSGWESGLATPSREKILTLAGYFGVTPDEMFDVFTETKKAGEKAREEKNASAVQVPTVEPQKVYNLVSTGMGNYTVDASLREIELDIAKDFEDVKKSFFKIGYKLYVIDEAKLFLKSGYTNIIDYAQVRFGIGKTTTYNLINVYDSFKAGFGSPEIAEGWDKYSYAQLCAMTNAWCQDTLLKYVQKSDTVEDIKKFIAIWNRSYRLEQRSPEGNTLREVLNIYNENKVLEGKSEDSEDVGEEEFVQNAYEAPTVEVISEESEPMPVVYEKKKSFTTPGKIRETVKSFLNVESRYGVMIKSLVNIDKFVEEITNHIMAKFNEIFQSDDFNLVDDA